MKPNKYIHPEYTLSKIETNDVITASVGFEINDDAQNDKVDYVISPENVFGV